MGWVGFGTADWDGGAVTASAWGRVLGEGAVDGVDVGVVGVVQVAGDWVGWAFHLIQSPGAGHMVRPPSTTSTWPVMKPASGVQRKAMDAATSSAVPKRFSGVRFM